MPALSRYPLGHAPELLELGQLIAWGRKPWLGLQFRSLIRNP